VQKVHRIRTRAEGQTEDIRELHWTHIDYWYVLDGIDS